MTKVACPEKSRAVFPLRKPIDQQDRQSIKNVCGCVVAWGGLWVSEQRPGKEVWETATVKKR